MSRLLDRVLLLIVISAAAVLPSSATGVPDRSFGNGGILLMEGAIWSQMMLKGPDEKIYVLGRGYLGTGITQGMIVSRYNPDGSPDTTYDGDGRSPLTGLIFGTISQQPDGKILFTGGPPAPAPYYDSDSMMIRLNTDGSRDLGFGTGGGVYQTNQYAGLHERYSNPVFLPDGKIMGFIKTTTDGLSALFRFNANGTPDRSFGIRGFIQMSDLRALAAVANNKYLFAVGSTITRIFPDMSVDTTFGTNGSIDVAGGVSSIQVMPDGRFMVNGSRTLRYSSEGVLDTTFQANGFSIGNGPAAIFPDGRFVNIGLNLYTARNSFVGTAYAVLPPMPFPPSSSNVVDVEIMSDGKILALEEHGYLFRFKSITSRANGQVDMDGDHRADLGYYRPGGSFEYLKSTYGYSSHHPQNPVGRIMMENYRGLNRSELAWWTPSTPQSCFFGFHNYAAIDACYAWGIPGDIPVGGDFDADGKTEIAIFRQGKWAMQQTATLTYRAIYWGMAGDKPVPADYDGDGTTDAAVYRPSEGTWHVLRSTDGGAYQIQWGLDTDKPVPADYDGDGRADLAVYRSGTGTWYIFKSGGEGYTAVRFGKGQDLPVPGDYDGDGLTDIAVFRPSEGNWYQLRSYDGFRAVHFGQAGDIPFRSVYSAD